MQKHHPIFCTCYSFGSGYIVWQKSSQSVPSNTEVYHVPGTPPAAQLHISGRDGTICIIHSFAPLLLCAIETCAAGKGLKPEAEFLLSLVPYSFFISPIFCCSTLYLVQRKEFNISDCLSFHNKNYFHFPSKFSPNTCFIYLHCFCRCVLFIHSSYV